MVKLNTFCGSFNITWIWWGGRVKMGWGLRMVVKRIVVVVVVVVIKDIKYTIKIDICI